MKRRMRSHARPMLSLGTITVSSLALASCGEQSPDAFVFKSPQQCVMSGIGADVCDIAFRDAMKDYGQNAPRFADQTACEASFGTNLCTRSARSPQDTAPFTPVLTGFYLSRNVRSMADYDADRKRQEEEEQAPESSGGGGSSGGGSFRFGSGSAVYKDRRDTAMVARSKAGEGGSNAYRLLSNVSYGVPETTARSGFGHWESSRRYGS